jgi:hypothetical protein
LFFSIVWHGWCTCCEKEQYVKSLLKKHNMSNHYWMKSLHS